MIPNWETDWDTEWETEWETERGTEWGTEWEIEGETAGETEWATAWETAPLYQKLTIKHLFCRDLIASVHAATPGVCFLWVSVPKSLQNFVFFSPPAGPDPPASLAPAVPFGALEKRTTPARELHF